MWRFMASQLRQPSGWFGALVMSRLLNRGNAKIVDATLALLEIRPEHRALEIGFGGGYALSRLAKEASHGVITGVDLSPEMLRQAERRFRRQIAAGRLRLQLADAADLPFPDATFDRVFTINTIYFWPDPLRALAEMHRVLRPDGLAAVSLRSKNKMEKHAVTKHGFRLFSAEDAATSMGQAGFQDVRADHRDRDKWTDQIVVLGTRRQPEA